MEPGNLSTVHLLHTNHIQNSTVTTGQAWPRPSGHSGGGQLRTGVRLDTKGALPCCGASRSPQAQVLAGCGFERVPLKPAGVIKQAITLTHNQKRCHLGGGRDVGVWEVQRQAAAGMNCGSSIRGSGISHRGQLGPYGGPCPLRPWRRHLNS